MENADYVLMKTALRVLSAFAEKCQPNPADLQRLRQYSKSGTKDLRDDELACEIVQQTLRNRAKSRSAGA